MKTTLRRTLPIYLASLMAYFHCFPMAFLALMFQWFPDVPQTTVMLISTMPALVSIFACLSMGALMLKLDKKLLMIIGLTLNLICGALIYLTNGGSIYLVIICSAVTGIGYGMISTVTNAALADVVPQEKLSRAIGINNAVSAVGLMLMNMAGGVLANNGTWVSAYSVGFVTLPILIIVIIFAPVMKPKTVVNDETKTAKPKASKKDIILLACFLLAFTIFFVGPNGLYLNYSSYIIDEFALGTAVETATAASVQSFGGLIGGFVLTGLLAKYLKKWSVTFSLIVISVAIMAMCFITNSVYVVYIAEFFTPAFAVAVFSECMAAATKTIPQTELIISFFTAITGVGMFIAPYILNFLASMLGGNIIAKLWASIALIIVGGIAMVIIMRAIDKNAEEKAVHTDLE